MSECGLCHSLMTSSQRAEKMWSTTSTSTSTVTSSSSSSRYLPSGAHFVTLTRKYTSESESIKINGGSTALLRSLPLDLLGGITRLNAMCVCHLYFFSVYGAAAMERHQDAIEERNKYETHESVSVIKCDTGSQDSIKQCLLL